MHEVGDSSISASVTNAQIRLALPPPTQLLLARTVNATLPTQCCDVDKDDQRTRAHSTVILGRGKVVSEVKGQVKVQLKMIKIMFFSHFF